MLEEELENCPICKSPIEPTRQKDFIEYHIICSKCKYIIVTKGAKFELEPEKKYGSITKEKRLKLSNKCKEYYEKESKPLLVDTKLLKQFL